jgi:RHS repeat-associated protein
MAYNALGQRTQIARFQSTGTANPVATTDFTYDTANRLSGMAHKQGATNLNTYAYTYDPLSRLATVDSTLDGLTSYNYNQNDEVRGANNTGAANESYDYDANGNPNTTGFVTASDNRMTASLGFTYFYDNEGNLTRRTNTISGAYTTYTWDHRNRLTQVTERTQTNTRISEINYEYDAFNRLVRRYDALAATFTPVTYWVYDEGTNPLLEYFGGDPLIQHRYVWSDNVDDLLADEQNPGLSSRNTLWALSDHLGSIRDIADTNESTGTTSIANHRRYDSFGRRVWETNDAVDLVFGYTGKLFDETTRLQNNLNRWYDSSTGRWISQDPIGFAAGDANLYRYVGNSPTNATDPNGLIERGDGHHLLPWSIFTEAGFSSDVQDYFNGDNARLRDDLYKSHNGGRVRGISEPDYRREVQKIFDEFMSGRDPAKVTRRQAESLIGKIRNSENSIVKNYLQGVEAEIKLAKETAHVYIRKAKRAGRYFDDALWREARDHADEVVKLTRKGITARVLSKVTSSRAGKGIAGFLGFYAIASDGNVTGAELSRACADMTPLGWSLMGGEVLGEATEYLQDEIERTAEINRTSERWWMGPAHSRPTYNDCDR